MSEFDPCFTFRQNGEVIARTRSVARRINVLVAPRASRNKIVLLEDGSLKVFVSAPAVNGQANEAVVRLVAKWAGVPQKDVSIVAGHRSRRKTLQVNY
jgi:uncharacterized protein (TIGR00251 family)